MTPLEVKAVEPFAAMADEVERCAAEAGNEPDGWALSAMWKDLIAARAALTRAKAALAETGCLFEENPDFHSDFVALSPTTPLPWNEHPSKRQLIVDACGEEVCVVDGSGDDPSAIVGMILVAVNSCGGFKAEIVDLPPAPCSRSTLRRASHERGQAG